MSESSEISTPTSERPIRGPLAAVSSRTTVFLASAVVAIIALGAFVASTFSLDSLLAQKGEELRNLKAQVSELDGRKTRLEDELLQLADKEAHVARLNRAIEGAKTTVAGLEQQISDARSQLPQIRSTSDGLKKGIEDLTEQRRNAEKALKDVMVQRTELDQEIRSLRTSADDAEKAARRADDSKKIAQGELAKAQRDLAELEGKRAAAAKDVSSLTGEISELLGRKKTIDAALAEARAETGRLSKDAENLKTDTAKRTAELRKTEADLETQQRKLDLVIAEEAAARVRVSAMKADEVRLAKVLENFPKKTEDLRKARVELVERL